MGAYIEIAYWLLAGHAIADFALQTRWMTAAKDHLSALNKAGQAVWPIALSAHGLIHGAAVSLATGSVTLGALETVSHMAIDFSKSAGRIGIYVDQGLHVACKGLWLGLLIAGIA
ncbi:MAG: DUF3307 domain-containing protein [Pseudomonadota bacterium]